MFQLEPIGIIHSPWKTASEAPAQSSFLTDSKAEVEIFEPFVLGLRDLTGFSHIILIYFLHKSESYKMQIYPRNHDQLRGLFATRSPHRPNPIGYSVVKLQKVENNRLYISGIDAISGTPLLDIKPYIPELDLKQMVETGWLEDRS